MAGNKSKAEYHTVMKLFDVIIIGGGQSGLAVAYYLRRTGLSFIILDSQTEGGGAWLNMWESLRLFSPAQWSSLPGTLMQGGNDYYPTRNEAVEYLRHYETKYNLPIKRPVLVHTVRKEGDEFQIHTSDGLYLAKAVVSATGSFTNPYIPNFEGKDQFKGIILHSSEYTSPQQFRGKRVAVIGEGNSGAQILAEVSKVAETIWITSKEPRFLPDEVDGRYLFDAATQMYEAQKQGKQFKPPSLGDIVMVDTVKEARDRNVLHSLRPFDYFTEDAIVWKDMLEEKVDAVIFCTGFKSSLRHLAELNVINGEGRIDTRGTKAKHCEGLWLVGYGNWTGFASATLIGVGRSAKTTVEELGKFLTVPKESQPV
jgi:putative flavoprotein involved in K+ transport